MAYRFKLEALRNYRLFQEEMRQKEFADNQRRLDGHLARLDAIIADRREAELGLRRCQTEAATGPQITVYLQYLKKLARDVELQSELVDKARVECDQSREALLEAMKKRKALEKLKENGIKQYLENLNHDEMKFINEIAINRYTLKQR